MRYFDIKYQLRGIEKVETFKALTSNVAILKLMSKLTRRDKLFFKLLSISMA